MAERKLLCNLDLERFREVWDHQNWSDLQNAFRSENIHLSKSLLAWTGESGDKWLLSDFENKKTYDIEMVGDATENPMVEVWERGSDEEQPVTSKISKDILSHLLAAQGTDRGFIDLMTKLNLDDLDLDRLKRSDLSGAGFSLSLCTRIC